MWLLKIKEWKFLALLLQLQTGVHKFWTLRFCTVVPNFNFAVDGINVKKLHELRRTWWDQFYIHMDFYCAAVRIKIGYDQNCAIYLCLFMMAYKMFSHWHKLE